MSRWGRTGIDSNSGLFGKLEKAGFMALALIAMHSRHFTIAIRAIGFQLIRSPDSTSNSTFSIGATAIFQSVGILPVAHSVIKPLSQYKN